MAENTQVAAPAASSEVDPLAEMRAKLAEKRKTLSDARAARESYQKDRELEETELRLKRESDALDAELRYEAEAAKILLGSELKRDEDGSLIPPDQSGVAVGEVEDGVYAGQAYVAPAVVPEDLRGPEMGAINLPPEDVASEVKLPEPPTAPDTADAGYESDTSIPELPLASYEVNTSDEDQE